MAKKMSMAKKKKRGKRMGRPITRGPTVNVSFRMTKAIANKIQAIRKSVKKTQTEVIETLLKAGLRDHG